MDNFLGTIKGFFEYTGLNNSVSTILTALLILFIGWIIANAIRGLVRNMLKKTNWDEKLMGGATGSVSPNNFFANLVYYLIMLVVLLTVLEVMGISQVLDPLKNMLNEFFGFIPNLVAAGVIGFIGYIIATFVSNLISMGGSVVDNIALKSGIKDTNRLVDILKKVAFILILFPFIIQALNALQLDAITGPANEVLSSMFNILPNLLGAAAVIGLFVIGGRFVTSFLQDLLVSLGTDTLPERMQLGSVMGQGQSLSRIISGLVFFFLVAFGIITGVEMLQFDRLSEILNNILEMTGHILFGLLIMVLGNFIATTVHGALSKSEDNKTIATIARWAILGLFLAISLRTMGIANSIVELAFGLTLGAIAIAVALAYGLGGREAAGEHAKDILNRFRKK